MSEPIVPKISKETDAQENAAPEKQDLTSEEVRQLAGLAIDAIGGKISAEKITPENFKEKIENAILDGVQGLPELLAEKLKKVDIESFNARAEELLSKIAETEDTKNLAELQIELIYQYIGIISRVQNGGDKGFTPALAKEFQGLDCSLSTWALKEKLQNSKVPHISFEFGYPPEHAVALITLADGRRIYTDAQDGFVEEPNLEQEQVSDPQNTDTAYPIFEITSSKRILGHLPDGGEVTHTRPEGGEFHHKYFGARKDGLLHTLGNMHMLLNPGSITFYSESARRFRAGLGMPEMEPSLYQSWKAVVERWQAAGAKDSQWDDYLKKGMDDQLSQAYEYEKEWPKYWEKFDRLVEKIAGGKTIYETEFFEKDKEYQRGFQSAESAARDQKEIDEVKRDLGI